MQQPARSARVRADRVIHHSRLKCPVPEITCLTISPIATAGRAKVAKTAPGAKQSEADIGNIRERCDKAPRRFSPLLCKVFPGWDTNPDEARACPAAVASRHLARQRLRARDCEHRHWLRRARCRIAGQRLAARSA